MKKILLMFAASALIYNAQAQHLTLYEEFTGENCPPCASTNPALWSLVTAAGNSSKVLLLKYQTKIPSATNTKGIYLTTKANTTFVEDRNSYYSTPFAPYGRLDGIILGGPTNPGHAAYLNQARIDSVYALPAGLNIQVVSFKFNATNDSMTAVVKITAPAAYTPAGANLKLRAGFIQTLNYSSAADKGPTGKCGTNGEDIFENVIRQMLPDASGTALSNSWTANQTQTITLSAKIMSHISLKDENPFFAAWVQNDADKRVVNVARSSGADFPTNIKQVVTLDNVAIYPNPANNQANLQLTLSQSADVQVNVVDVTGRLIYTVAEAGLHSGANNIAIPTNTFAAGTYNVIINSNGSQLSQKLVVTH